MLGYESERRLKNILVCLGEGERDLEIARQRLCAIPDFAPHSAFERVDRDCNSLVLSTEIVAFLRDNACYHVSESEAFSLVCFFDSNGNARLTFQEFIQMFLPCEDNLLRNATLDRPSRRVGRYDHLPRDIELAMTAVIEKEIELARKLAVLKRELHVQYDYSPIAAYRSIDKYNSGRVDTIALGNFLRVQGHFSNEMELLAIIRRIDTNGDAILSFDETQEFLKPDQPIVTAAFEPIPASRPVTHYEHRGGSPMREKASPGRRASPVRVATTTVVTSSPPRGRAPIAVRETVQTTHSPTRHIQHTTYDTLTGKAVTTTTYADPLPPVRSIVSPVHRVSASGKPVLTPWDEDDLVHTLKQQCNLENELEQAKIMLA